jgi:hypothetical protein
MNSETMESNKRGLEVASIRVTNGTSPYPSINNTKGTNNSNSRSSFRGRPHDSREEWSPKSGLQSRIMQQLEIEEGNLALAYLRTDRYVHVLFEVYFTIYK